MCGHTCECCWTFRVAAILISQKCFNSPTSLAAALLAIIRKQPVTPVITITTYMKGTAVQQFRWTLQLFPANDVEAPPSKHSNGIGNVGNENESFFTSISSFHRWMCTQGLISLLDSINDCEIWRFPTLETATSHVKHEGRTKEQLNRENLSRRSYVHRRLSSRLTKDHF